MVAPVTDQLPPANNLADCEEADNLRHDHAGLGKLRARGVPDALYDGAWGDESGEGWKGRGSEALDDGEERREGRLKDLDLTVGS